MKKLGEPYPGLEELLAAIGESGQRLSNIKACEGAAGNISVCVAWPLEVATHFPISERIELPQPSPALAGKWVMVTGSGCRLCDIRAEPTANLGVVVVSADGLSRQLYTSPNREFERVTSEFNSHL